MRQKKTFWFINQYSSTPETAMGGRHYYLAQELAKKGHQVYVIAGRYSHLLRNPKQFDEQYFIEEIIPNFSFVWVNLPEYQEAHSKQRVLNWFKFSWLLRNMSNVIPAKPDVILYSSPSLIGYLGAKYLANKFRVPFIFEVRDIWPLTLMELGGHSANHPFIKFMQWIEDRAYKKADYVFSNLYNAIEHMQSRGLDPNKFHWIPNGVSLEEVSQKQPLNTETLSQLPKNKFIIGYTGTIGVANAIDDLIEAAKILSSSPQLHFVLVGSGKEKEGLIRKVQSLGLRNITFIDAIPKKQIQSMLEKFDICYIGWQKNSLYRFGIAPNKLPEYLYAGKPIIHAFSGKGDIVQQAQAGITIEAEDPEAIVEAVEQLYNLTAEQRQRLGTSGKQFVLQHLEYRMIAEKLENIVFK
ncbi:glycosyltransferase family 4 protein [Acinetobacter dispersus]|uniref:glycosyltransferase family 4 protein n=1 Tax=Acinetobacter dispersus TaxID=70348 RepID=UPI00132E74AA|nr:glycosyltransferase family 4 protein [Acinetobacter dispersus]MCH7385313.1 glycosyltransferase family 4 protein [Acinetobacter dispersus]QHH98583.1 glycosyltransferase family 4 protein [Acinetobacter dispersus]